MYCTVTAKHFILKLISFLAKIWHVILHLVTPPLVLLTAWIPYGIAECMTSRSSEFKVHQIWLQFLKMSVFYILHPTNVTHNTATVSIYGGQIYTARWQLKNITTLVPGECVNILKSFSKVRYLVKCLGHSAFILEFYIVFWYYPNMLYWWLFH